MAGREFSVTSNPGQYPGFSGLSEERRRRIEDRMEGVGDLDIESPVDGFIAFFRSVHTEAHPDNQDRLDEELIALSIFLDALKHRDMQLRLVPDSPTMVKWNLAAREILPLTHVEWRKPVTEDDMTHLTAEAVGGDEWRASVPHFAEAIYDDSELRVVKIEPVTGLFEYQLHHASYSTLEVDKLSKTLLGGSVRVSPVQP